MKRPGQVLQPGSRPAGARTVLLAAGLMIAGVVLGFFGYQDQAGHKSEWDNAYDALRLLVLDQQEVGDVRATLQVGRWMAAVGTAVVAIVTLYRVFGETRERFRAGRQRDHAVVVGLGHYGSYLARSFGTTGATWKRAPKVVGIELDPGSPSLAGLRAERVPIVTGDAADPKLRLLEQAAVGRARYLVVTCGDDGLNAQIAQRAGSLVSDRRRALTAFVHLDDLRLWPQLKAHAVASRGSKPVRIEFFNVFESGARIMLDAHPPFASGASGPPPSVLVMGFGEMGEQVLVQAARLWSSEPASESHPIAVTVVAPDAVPRVARLLSRHPRLGQVARVEVVERELDLAPPEAHGLLADGVGIAYVCAERDADGVATTLALHPAARAHGVPVVLVLDDDDRGLGPSLTQSERLPSHVSVFGLVRRALPPELLVRGTTEVLAMAKHEHYLATELAKGADVTSNPSATSWERLPESLRESNRAFADRIAEKLDAARCMLVPEPFASADDNGFAFTADEVEDLAQSEHRHWCADLERDGWRLGEVKDAERKRHPLLVPWHELPESEREKDRAPVRELPKFVARAGFEIVRVSSG